MNDIQEKEIAIAGLREAYAVLNNRDREEEMAATIELFDVIADVDSEETARRWIRRQAELIREES